MTKLYSEYLRTKKNFESCFTEKENDIYLLLGLGDNFVELKILEDLMLLNLEGLA